MEKQKLTKQDLKSPDAFIFNMQRLGEWAYEQRILIVGIVAVIILAAVVWAGVGTYHAQREDKAQEVLFTAEKKLHAADDAFNPPPNSPDMPPGAAKAADKKAAVPRSGDVNVDYKDSLPALKSVVAQYGDTQAAVIAELDTAKLYDDYKKYDDEIPLLNKAVATSTSPVTKAMAYDDLGMAYEAKGDCNQAIAQWSKIGDGQGMAAFLGNSLIKTALCYEKLNQTDKAAATYKRFDDAEREMKKLTDSLAVEYNVNPNLPPDAQDKKNVERFRGALTSSARFQELESLLSDRQDGKLAKKYLKLIKKGSS